MGLTLIRHGSPEDRGTMDAYYGRDPDPHCFEGNPLSSPRRIDLTTQELSEYYKGYITCTDRKEW